MARFTAENPSPARGDRMRGKQRGIGTHFARRSVGIVTIGLPRGIVTSTSLLRWLRAAELISHAVSLYHAFNLSFRDVELLRAERGVIVSHESIRRWCLKFGSTFADNVRRRHPRPGDKWHLDEVFIRIQGELRYLWRAVDQVGIVLDVLVQSRRDGVAAKRFFKRLLRGRRERQMQRFKSIPRHSVSYPLTLSSLGTSARDAIGPPDVTSRLRWPDTAGSLSVVQ